MQPPVLAQRAADVFPGKAVAETGLSQGGVYALLQPFVSVTPSARSTTSETPRLVTIRSTTPCPVRGRAQSCRSFHSPGLEACFMTTTSRRR